MSAVDAILRARLRRHEHAIYLGAVRAAINLARKTRDPKWLRYARDNLTWARELRLGR